ncbi:MAG TPA: hypothetical protein VGM91_23950 [Conexibacter sp.]|jgi:hypothetical protein
MPRRPLLALLTAVALLAAVPASSHAATVPAAGRGPAARAADDSTSALDPTTDDGSCSDDPDVDLPACGEDWSDESDDSGNDGAICDDTSDFSEDGSGDLSDDGGDVTNDGGDSSDDGSDPSSDAGSDVGDDDGGDVVDCGDDSSDDDAPIVSSLRAALAGGVRGKVNVSFELDGPGMIDLTLTRLAPGTQHGKRCLVSHAAAKKATATSADVKRAKGAAKKGVGAKHAKPGKACTKVVPVRGSVSFDGDEGVNVTTIHRRFNGVLCSAAATASRQRPSSTAGRARRPRSRCPLRDADARRPYFLPSAATCRIEPSISHSTGARSSV